MFKKLTFLMVTIMIITLLFSGIGAAKTVRVLTWKTATAVEIQKLVPEFEEETGIDVKMEIFPEPVLREKVMLDLASGTGTYDIFLTGSWVLPEYAEAGYLYPLNDLVENKPSKWFSQGDFASAYLDALKYKNELYAMPYYGHVGVLMYRKDWFEEEGLEVPQTTEELLNAAKALNDPPNRYGIAFRGKRGEDNPIITTSLTWVFGGEWLDENMKPAVDSKEFIDGVKYVKELSQYAPPDMARYGWVEVENSFTQGKVAMIMDASDFIGRIEDPDNSPIAGNIGYALIPEGPAAPRTERYASELFTAGMGINADSPDVEEAWKFLQWMTCTEVQRRTALQGNNTGITSLPILNDSEFKNSYPGIDVMLKALEYANPHYMPRIPCYSELCDSIGTHISSVIAGTEEPESAMKAAARGMLKPLVEGGHIK